MPHRLNITIKNTRFLVSNLYTCLCANPVIYLHVCNCHWTSSHTLSLCSLYMTWPLTFFSQRLIIFVCPLSALQLGSLKSFTKYTVDIVKQGSLLLLHRMQLCYLYGMKESSCNWHCVCIFKSWLCERANPCVMLFE